MIRKSGNHGYTKDEQGRMNGMFPGRGFMFKKTIATIAVAMIILLSSRAYADMTRVSESVNLRQAPSLEAAVIKLIPMGYEIQVLGAENSWAQVVFEGSTGYIRSDFIEIVLGVQSSLSEAVNNESAAAPTQGVSSTQVEPPTQGEASGQREVDNNALMSGSEGEAVLELQSLLKDCGYYSGPVSGKFGPLTEAAVRRFQESNGLVVDGEAGAKTLSKLNEIVWQMLDLSEVLVYKSGDEGDDIVKIQTVLAGKSYYSGPKNGKFGPLTEAAVRKFQNVNGLEVDGVVGKETLKLLYTAGLSLSGSKAASQTSANAAQAKKPSAGKVELTEWSEAKKAFTIGVTASVYDVRTGISYNVKSFSNGKHADVEPVTKEDTALLKKTYNGKWSWTPRPVWVTINGKVMAASINGMPHAGGINNENGMDGQVCIHFKGSSTHNGNKSFAKQHQDAVMEAWNAAK